MAVHMDATRVASLKAFDDRRPAVLGGTMEAGTAVIGVPHGTTLNNFVNSISDVVDADSVNVFAISPVRPGFVAQEVALLPYQHVRQGLAPELVDNLPVHTALKEFEQADKLLEEVSKFFKPVSFGCDCGVEGNQVLNSLHRTSGTKLAIVESRQLHPSVANSFLARAKVHIVLNVTKDGHPIAGVPDACHILKRQYEQITSGSRFLRIGPNHVATLGIGHKAGIHHNYIVKDDAMSDTQTAGLYSAESLRHLQSLGDTNQWLDPFGTIVHLFFSGLCVEALASPAIHDCDRVSMMYV